MNKEKTQNLSCQIIYHGGKLFPPYLVTLKIKLFCSKGKYLMKSQYHQAKAEYRAHSVSEGWEETTDTEFWDLTQ